MKKETLSDSTVETQKESIEVSTPDVIEIIISEVDRQTADDYCNNGRCLIATALMNRGYNVYSVAPLYVTLTPDKWEEYVLEGGLPSELRSNSLARQAPFYHPEVVGEVITLRRAGTI